MTPYREKITFPADIHRNMSCEMARDSLFSEGKFFFHLICITAIIAICFGLKCLDLIVSIIER